MFHPSMFADLFGGVSQKLYKITVPKGDICKREKLMCLACFSSPAEFPN